MASMVCRNGVAREGPFRRTCLFGRSPWSGRELARGALARAGRLDGTPSLGPRRYLRTDSGFGAYLVARPGRFRTGASSHIVGDGPDREGEAAWAKGRSMQPARDRGRLRERAWSPADYSAHSERLESGAKTGPTDSNNALQRTTAHNRLPAQILEWRLPLNANVGQTGAVHIHH